MSAKIALFPQHQPLLLSQTSPCGNGGVVVSIILIMIYVSYLRRVTIIPLPRSIHVCPIIELKYKHSFRTVQ